MWKYDTGTPCPAPVTKRRDFAATLDASKQTAASSSVQTNYEDYGDNTTQNIARLIQSEFKNASPKRRQTLAQKPRRNVPVSIFEDKVHGAAQSDSRGTADPSRPARSVIGARPARKIHLETVKETQPFPAPVNHHEAPSLDDTLFDLEGPRLVTSKNLGRGSHRIEDGEAAKEDRRRSIWVPSEDTTVFTIHPGAYTHALQDDTFCLSNNHASSRTAKTTVPSPVTAKSRKPPRPSMSVAPKRAPLASLAPVRSNASLGDRAGSGGGKENIPPNARLLQLKAEGKRMVKNASPKSPQIATSPFTASSQPTRRDSVFMQPTATSQAKLTSVKKRPIADIKDDVRKAKVPVTKDPRSLNIQRARLSDKHTDSQSSSPDTYLPKRAPTKMAIPDVRPTVGTNLSRYPVLPEDLDQPQLYEDNWLSHQEIALTQLVNGVFQQADNSSFLLHNPNTAGLRGNLLKPYQDPAVATLHKRLKASLLYGALSLPKDATSPPRLTDDIGLRRQFLDLWMHSYDLDSLQAAAEVVIGRVITVRPRDATTIAQSLGSNSGTPESPKAKELRRFLLTFLVHHEDAVDASIPQSKTTSTRKSGEEAALKVGTPEWYWQRTVLHSLMLIYLLDTAKSTGTISSCLFQPSSIRKSSVSFLQALSRMLLPSVGDIVRPLNYLDYKMQHTQHPLEEYVYRIDNIAIDLRNGVLLTRFVELLLYSPSSLNARHDDTITLSLPDGETLTSMTTTSHILSQHLKVPCLSRAQKQHNVQIALSALSSINDMLITSAISHISTSDIVDGHREKTLSLLWALVSRWGMSLLIDWDELARETQRFTLTSSSPTMDTSTTDSDFEASALLSWARAVCAPDNIHISNLTTSFASGAALAAILATYTPFLPAATATTKRHSTTTAATASIPQTLKSLSCSTAFSALFVSPSTIPSRTTTLALLAFLASRLLPLARVHRAAALLQRTYRLRLQRRTVSARIRCAVLAAQCKLVVEAKNRILDAVVLLQRTWRGVLDRRIRGLEGDVVAFQRVARGWAFRQGLCGGEGGSRRRGRVMGGW